MAEVDVEVPSTAPEAQAEGQASTAPESTELPSYDPAKLIMVKGKVKKPVKPDDTERNLTLERLSAEIKKHSDRIAEIKAIRDARRSRGVNPEAAEHKKRKEGLSAEFSAVLKQKMHIREEFQRASTEREVIKNELRELRSKLPRGTRLDTLEADIQQAEYRMEHESLSATEEKKTQTQLQSLVGARPLARQIGALEEKLKVVEANRGSAKTRLDQCDAVLEGISAKRNEANAALDEIRRERDEANVDLPALEVEKQECWEIIQVLRSKMNEVRDDFNAKWKEWSELNKHWSAWRRHESHKQYLERQAFREQRDAERNGDGPSPAALAGTIQAEPYESEILTIDQLLTYLRKYVGAEEEIAAKVEQKAVEVPQGLKPFKRKDEEDLSFFKAVEKKGKGAKGAKQEKAAPATETKKKINHTLEVLQTFMILGIDVPQTTAEIPVTVQKAEAKKQEFLEKRKQAKEAPPPAPKAQVLPADDLTNGHGEEEEEEETTAPPPEPETVPVPEVQEEEEEAPAPAPAPAPAAAPSPAKEVKEVKEEKEEVKEEEKAAPAPEPAAAPAPEPAAAPAAKEEAAPAAAVEEKAAEAKPASKKAEKATPAKKDAVGVTIEVDASSQSLSLKLDVPAGL